MMELKSNDHNNNTVLSLKETIQTHTIWQFFNCFRIISQILEVTKIYLKVMMKTKLEISINLAVNLQSTAEPSHCQD